MSHFKNCYNSSRGEHYKDQCWYGNSPSCPARFTLEVYKKALGNAVNDLNLQLPQLEDETIEDFLSVAWVEVYRAN